MLIGAGRITRWASSPRRQYGSSSAIGAQLTALLAVTAWRMALKLSTQMRGTKPPDFGTVSARFSPALSITSEA